MRVAKKRSYSFILIIVFFHLTHYILFLFYHILFLPYPEGAVGPISYNDIQVLSAPIRDCGLAACGKNMVYGCFAMIFIVDFAIIIM